MNVLYLAAGRGTRLQPITHETPKPLIWLRNETILGRLYRQFRSIFPEGNHWINLSTMPQKFVEEFCNIESQYQPNFVWEPKLLGGAKTLESIWRVSSLPILIVHADLVLSDKYVLKIREVLHNTDCAKNLIFCHTRPQSKARSYVRFNEQFEVLEFIQGLSKVNKSRLVHVNSGVYFFATPFFALGSIRLGTEITECQIPSLIEQKLLFAHILLEKRIAIDDMEALNQAKSSPEF
jgi:NDP-sugar pyrophosphorylase family protein